MLTERKERTGNQNMKNHVFISFVLFVYSCISETNLDGYEDLLETYNEMCTHTVETFGHTVDSYSLSK